MWKGYFGKEGHMGYVWVEEESGGLVELAGPDFCAGEGVGSAQQ